MLDPGLHQQTIDHYLNRVILALVETEIVFQIHQLAVDPCAIESVLDELFHLFLELAFSSADDGRHDHDPVVGRQGHDALDDLLRRLARDGLAASRTVRHSNRGIEQAQVVVDFGNRADGGARTAAGGLLLNRDRRAQTVDGVNIGALHLIEKLPRVGGECFHVAADGHQPTKYWASVTWTGPPEMLESGITQFDYRILVVNRGGRQTRIE